MSTVTWIPIVSEEAFIIFHSLAGLCHELSKQVGSVNSWLSLSSSRNLSVKCVMSCFMCMFINPSAALANWSQQP